MDGVSTSGVGAGANVMAMATATTAATSTPAPMSLPPGMGVVGTPAAPTAPAISKPTTLPIGTAANPNLPSPLVGKAPDSNFRVTGVSGSNPPSLVSALPTSSTAQAMPPVLNRSAIPSDKVLDKRRLQELVKEVDPLEQLDEDVEEMLLQIADDFIDNVVTAGCQLARHRKSNTVEVKDMQLHLERNWNMWVPGFGSEELRPYKKAATTEAHKQRLALIKKTLKKY